MLSDVFGYQFYYLFLNGNDNMFKIIPITNTVAPETSVPKNAETRIPTKKPY